MLAQTSQPLIIVLVFILLPSALPLPYSIYGVNNNYLRASRTNSNLPPLAAPQQHYDQTYRSPSNAYYANYDTAFDSGMDKYYVDDEDDDRTERKYLYGKPTYHGEYKPSRYYYARPPNFNYYNDQMEPSNPMDDLHEEMLQEDERQRSWPTGYKQYYQNTGLPKSLTNDYLKNYMLYNNGMEADTQPIDTAAYDDDEVNTAPLSEPNEPYDYYEPLKFQPNHFSYFEPYEPNKPTYFNQDNRKPSDNRQYDSHTGQRSDYDDESHEDKDEKDLESLRKNKSNNDKKVKYTEPKTFDIGTREQAYNSNDASFDYDDDQWINWDRKRSLPNKQNPNLRPLKVLEYELTKSLQHAADSAKVSTTTTAPPTTSTIR